MVSKTVETFFELVGAGLWERDVQLSPFLPIIYSDVFRLAQEQSVVGLVAAGLEHVVDVKNPPKALLPYMSYVLTLEQQNTSMNHFVETMVEEMCKKEKVCTLLLKGQGVAQCYERPLWRACGDVDILLNGDDYYKAKEFLLQLASSSEKEYLREKHLGMIVGKWVVELHGSLYGGLSSRIDEVLDDIHQESFNAGKNRTWQNGNTRVFLLEATNDVLYVFSHFLNHFYKDGVGLRQICDWCRLLWTYRNSINHELLEKRLKQMGLISEWKAFGALAIEYLGFPKEYMPLLDVRSKKEDVRWRKKADRIMEFILKSGNMGHNRDMSHFSKYPYLIRKCVSMGRRISDLINHARIFPLDSLRFFPRIMFNGVRSAMRGE